MDPFERLRINLAAALQAKPEKGEEENAPRIAAWAALDATISFLREIDVEAELRAPLLHLLAALDDANNGRSNAMLEPRPYVEGDHQKMQTFVVALRAMAAAAVTILHQECSISIGAALLRVSKALGLDKNILAEFRKNLARGGERAPAAAKAEYEWWFEERKRRGEMSASEFVDVMLTVGPTLQPPKGQ